MARSQYKLVAQDYDVVASLNDELGAYVCLSQLEAAVIVAALQPYRWVTRWNNLPDDADALTFIDNLIGKLMSDNCGFDLIYGDCTLLVKYPCAGDYVVVADIRECVKGIIKDTTIEDPPWDRTDGQYDGDSRTDDLGCLWGACFNHAKYMIAQANRSLDLIEAIADVIEEAQDIMNLFPVGVAYKTALELATVAESLTILVIRDYLTNPDTETDMACSLFCFWRLRQSVPPYVWNDDIYKMWRGEFFSAIGISLDPRLYFLAISTFSQGTLRAAQQFYLGLNDCSNDWESLCLDCGDDTWCQSFDFTTGPHGWEIYPRVGVFSANYISGTGWSYVDVTGGSYNHRAASIRIDIPADANITRVEVSVDYAGGTFDTNTTAFIVGSEPPDGDQAYIRKSDMTNGTDIEITKDFDINTDANFFVYLRCCARHTGAQNGNAVIRAVTLRGMGANPFGVDNC